jgi:putative transposase
MRTYRFRSYPSRSQEDLMRQHLWLSKELCNRMLDFSKNKHKTEKKFATKKELREMVKRQGMFSQVAQELIDRLIDATWRFVQLKRECNECGFPRFKSFERLKSLCYPKMGFKFVGNRLKVAPFGEIKLKLHWQVKGKIKTLTLKSESSGKWFAIFTAEEEVGVFCSNRGTSVGVDLGLSKLAVVSDGSIIANPRHIRKYERKIAVLGSQLSR